MATSSESVLITFFFLAPFFHRRDHVCSIVSVVRGAHVRIYGFQHASRPLCRPIVTHNFRRHNRSPVWNIFRSRRSYWRVEPVARRRERRTAYDSLERGSERERLSARRPKPSDDPQTVSGRTSNGISVRVNRGDRFALDREKRAGTTEG